MEIYIDHISPNDDVTDLHQYIDVTVCFRDDITPPHRSAEVHIFLAQKEMSLTEIRDAAIEKAKAFLSEALSVH